MVVVIYSYSEQTLTTRVKKTAESREKAVQSVRENAQAHEKWNIAKSFAKKGALHLSRTFSRRKSTKLPATMKGSALATPGNDSGLQIDDLSSTSVEPTGKKEPSNLSKMLQEIESNPDSEEGFNVEIGNKKVKMNPPKSKQTQSQIFRYAYNQIEKEKAMHENNKNLTYSGLISMANDLELRKRPTLEVSFQDLSIILNGKNRNLMRCVTGKLSPGRVSAVMGPSGAGKTTFLSALTGYVPGCTMTGAILVNGKAESIRSYKKIIGYVPQDDIVHGNLTVEENLWFSARCR